MVVTPLGQRQVFQAANAEAVRAAHQVSEQLQREDVRRKAADDKLLEDQASVREVTGSENIRTEERRGGKGGGEGRGTQEEAEESAQEAKPEEDGSEKKLDFLA